jgi:hypothetical protein
MIACLPPIAVFIVACAFMATFAFGGDLQESDLQVWKVGAHRWTIQDEYNYAGWIEANIRDDFFIRHGIRVDCADVPYAMRWIYARINHLPAAATTVHNRLIGHWSKDWARLPTDAAWERDRRFRAALMAMLSSTSTRTLPADTYPIRISADSVTAGTVFLIAEEHAGIVSAVVTDGSTAHPVQTFEAGSPARIQRLHLRNFILPDPGDDRISGLLKFRWPIETGAGWHYSPVKGHPFYSEEQYLPAFTDGYADYLEAVQKRIDPKVYDPEDMTEKIIHTLTRRLNERIPIVLGGNRKCLEIKCPEGSRFWEIYSTPDRDEFIGVMIDHLEGIIRKNHLDRDAILDRMAMIRLQISEDLFVTLREVFQDFRWLSPDPGATIQARWGLDKCGMIAINLKGAQGSIAFIQKKYGKTDPDFAERSIWTQQKIVHEMTEEGRKNRCAMGSPEALNELHPWN